METISTATFLQTQQDNPHELQTESEAMNIARAPAWYASLPKLKGAARLRKGLWRCVLVMCALCAAATATAGTWTTLDVDGETVRTYRDDFGRPHIFAETNRALFVAAGYTAAEDRLWQMILNVRASRGTLAQAFGSASLASDILVRTVGYTDAELDSQLAELPAAEQLVFQSYVDGVNRYLAEARLNPANKLPFEFFAVGLGVPDDLSVRDIVAITGFAMRRFAEVGGQELANKQTLDALTAKYGADGYKIFSDMRWLNDPDAPATIPTDGAIGRRQHVDTPASDSQLNAPTGLITDEEAVNEHWKQLGIPNRLGSFGWVVSAQKSAEGYPMLYGGPQMGLAAPEIVHEVQLKSDEGVNVTGMTMPGLPWVVIGHNRHFAWTMTSGLAGDNVDVYIEATCDAGGGAGSGYVYNGSCTPYEIRSETIAVRGAAATTITVRRSVHGPVVAALGSYTATQKRAHWMAELSSARAVGDINRATNIHAFEDAVSRFALALNFFYADQQGNIGYWLAGRNPLRAPGFDPRLPLPGDGSAEWLNGYRPIPKSINPARGWLANWNNKPTGEYADGDGGLVFSAEPFGGMHRYSDLAHHFEQTHISLQDMRDIPKDIARVNVVNRNGREARLLLPYLFKALDAVPPQHPLAAQARAVLEGWDGSMFADSVTSTTMLAGQVIFATWQSRVIANTFGDELGSLLKEATSGALLHALDQALAGGASVPVSRDYFNGVDPRIVLSRSFDEAVYGLTAAMGPVPDSWATPRGVIPLKHVLLGTLATVPLANRSTYAQIVQLKRPEIEAENILSLGQSGTIRPGSGGAPLFDPHFFDQLPLFTAFAYKPMVLYRNAP